jgi:glycosyltransferase involved in cell wall biosynthesis
MKILWLTWKDRKNPLAGGAEIVNEELAKRLVRDGHQVKFIVGGFRGMGIHDHRDGFDIHRVGDRFAVYFQAYRYYKQHLADWPDLVIDEMNTIPFFAKYYVKQPNVMFVHQLAREIWWYEMIFPLNLIGYLLEPLYLRLLSDRTVITISESTKADLVRFGFDPEKVHIISEGIEIESVADLTTIKKFDKPTILALGTVRSMKRTHHILNAFEMLKKKLEKNSEKNNPTLLPDLELIIAGKLEGSYGYLVHKHMLGSRYKDSIDYRGPVTRDEKIELMQRSHVLAVTSIKEGWGLVVTEAASQGTPAVVYDADGLRDSVRNGETGLITPHNTLESLAQSMQDILSNPEEYKRLRENAWQWSKEITFDKSYADFLAVLEDIK